MESLRRYYLNAGWAEELPESCPPNKAITPDNQEFFRLVEGVQPKTEDFFSHRKLYPTKKFKVDECTARSVSVFSALEQANEVLKLPALKNKKIAKIRLTDSSGKILQTGLNQKHYSWWMRADFDPIVNCQLVNQ